MLAVKILLLLLLLVVVVVIESGCVDRGVLVGVGWGEGEVGGGRSAGRDKSRPAVYVGVRARDERGRDSATNADHTLL